MISLIGIIFFSFLLSKTLADDNFDDISLRIVGGENADPGEYPFFGKLYSCKHLKKQSKQFVVVDSLLVSLKYNGQGVVRPSSGKI